MSEKATAAEISHEFQHRHLAAKLAEVQLAVERVPKRGHNQHFDYDFATESDITAAIRKEMAQRSLMLIPDIQEVTYRDANTKSGIVTIAKVFVQFRIIDGVTAEELVFGGVGEGEDASDKAVPKAITSALKYALLKLFLIPTGDDPEIEPKPKTKPAIVKGPIANAVARAMTPIGAVAQSAAKQLSAAHGAAGEPETIDVPDGYCVILKYELDRYGWHHATLSRPAGVEVKTKFDLGLELKRAFDLKVPVAISYDKKGYVTKAILLEPEGERPF